MGVRPGAAGEIRGLGERSCVILRELSPSKMMRQKEFIQVRAAEKRNTLLLCLADLVRNYKISLLGVEGVDHQGLQPPLLLGLDLLLYLKGLPHGPKNIT